MFSVILKELRKTKGLTQSQLANAIGVSQGTIYFWEKGINEPTASYLIALAKYFEMSIDELLGVDMAEDFSKDLIDFQSSARLIKVYNEMSEKQKDLLVDIANVILNR